MSPVDPAVRELSLSCLLLGYVGATPPPWVLDALAAGVGGVVLFGSNLGDGTDVRNLTDRLRAAAGRDLVLATDEEGGDVTRLDTVRGSASPGAAALGYLDDPDATEAVYAAIGNRLAEAGLTMNLAPVADVNVVPQNPVIGLRSFSSDADVAARHVAAAVRGTQRAGIAACIKHFPGHGATENDTHHELAVLHRSRAELEAVEFLPFRAGIDAGTRAVMTGHLIASALDPDRLATVSSVITEVLRGELGFDGAIVTDALEMRALADSLGLADGFVAALIAGADTIETGALDYPELIDKIPQAVARALDDGRLTRERLDEAARRTRALATPAAGDAGSATVDVAARCLEIGGRLPALHRPLVIECRTPNGMATGELPWSVAERISGAEIISLTGPPDIAELRTRAEGRTLVVVVRDVIRFPWQASILDLAATHDPSVIVDVGWPGSTPPGVPTVRTRGIAPGLLAVAVAALNGVGASR